MFSQRIPAKPILPSAGIFDPIDQLGPLPDVVARALRLLYDPGSDAGRVAQLIDVDPTLAGRLIGLANSAAFRGRDRMVTTRQAVIRLGYRTVGNLLMTAATSERLQQALPVYGLSRGLLWQHAVATALGAQAVADLTKQLRPDQAYLSGLLHDVGMIALATLSPDSPEPAIVRLCDSGYSIAAAELERFGMEHATAGHLLLTRWGVPEGIVLSVRHHHEPPGNHQDVGAAIVQVAEWISEQAGLGLGSDWFVTSAADTASDLGLTFADLDQLLNRLPGLVDSIKAEVGEAAAQ